MQITRNSLDTTAAPRDWFTGGAQIDAIAAPAPPSRAAAAIVDCATAARIVTKGVGRCQREGGPIYQIRQKAPVRAWGGPLRTPAR